MAKRTRGFTLVEVLIILAVVGIAFGVAIPRLESLSPKYAMRSAARELASQLEFVRSQAVMRVKTFAIFYELDRDRYTVVLPPEEGGSDLPVEDWPRLEPVSLPTLVKFHGIVLADNTLKETRDAPEVTVFFDPVGALGNHVVVLEDTEGRVLSVKFNALTGTVDFFEEVVGFARYE